MSDEPGKIGGAWASEALRSEQDAGLDAPRFEHDAPVLDPKIVAFLEELADHNEKQYSQIWQEHGIRTAYLAGPMRGYPEFNYPLFNAVAAHLRNLGYEIENPAQTDAEVAERAAAAAHPLSVYMERDLADVAKTQAVFVLPGWEQSEGATIETTVAWMLGHPVYELPTYKLVEPFFKQTHKDAPAVLPTDAAERKAIPITTGVLDYFPAALIEVAKVSKAGNDQHNPGEPLHWARGKSMDQTDTLVRHLMERGSLDSDGMRHSAKMAWRALAILQIELEEAGEAPLSRGSS